MVRERAALKNILLSYKHVEFMYTWTFKGRLAIGERSKSDHLIFEIKILVSDKLSYSS